MSRSAWGRQSGASDPSAPGVIALAEQEVGDDRRSVALVGDVVEVKDHRQHALEPAKIAEAEATMADRAVDLVEGFLERT